MTQTLGQSERWSAAEKVAFRFLFIFILLFIIIENNVAFPFFDWVMTYPTDGLHVLVPWLGENVLHLPYKITHFTYGSGDTTYDYVILLICFVVALVASVIWSLADRKAEGYPKLYYWLTV